MLFVKDWASLFPAYLVGALLAIVILLILLGRFRHQRRREVVLMWSSVCLIVNGGTPSKLGTPDKITDGVFFPDADVPVEPKLADDGAKSDPVEDSTTPEKESE